jgi:hypothetical protein
MQADTTHMGWTSVLWIGANDCNVGFPDTIANIGAAVDELETNQFIIMTIINADNALTAVGGEYYDELIAVNDYIITTYPNNHIDIRGYLLSEYDPAVDLDVIDYELGQTPFSLRIASDNVHLNNYGNALVIKRIRDFIAEKGW